MISSFFGKSKPINILIVAFLISLIFILAKVEYISSHFNLFEVFKITGFLALVVFSVFVLDFIIGKNSLTQNNSYTILLFGLFIALIPETIMEFNLVLSNLFILFALRRLISLHSKIEVKKKLFDAAFWIGLASICYFWAILFFALIIIALLYYSQNDIKNWIVPFVALLAVALIAVTFNVIVYDLFLAENVPYPQISLDFSSFNNRESIIRGTVFSFIFIWSSMLFIKSIGDKTRKIKPAYILVGVTVIIAFIVAVISPLKTRGEFVFLIAPLAIITTVYFERIQEKWVIDIVFGVLILTPLLLLML